MNEFLNSPALTIFLACLVPTASCCALNMHFFTTRQMLNSLGIAALLGCTLGLGAWWLHGLLAPIAAQHGLPGKALLAGGFGGVVVVLLYVLSQRFFVELIPKAGLRYGVVGGIILAAVGSIFFFSFHLLNILLFFVLTLSFFDAKKNVLKEKEIIFSDYKNSTKRKNTERTNVVFKHKPNIYLLLLESYQSKEALKKIYDIDDSLTEEIFKKYNFENYGQIFSNRVVTVYSTSCLFTCELFGVNSEKVFFIDALRENNYACNFIDSGPYVFDRFSQEEDYVSFYIPKHIKKIFSLCVPWFCQSSFLRKLVGGIDPFCLENNDFNIYETLKKTIKRSKKQANFTALRFGSVHSNMILNSTWVKDYSQHIDLYRKRFETAQEQLESIVSLIMEEDPNALVVAVGDHGGYRHWGALDSATPDYSIKKVGISLKDFVLSLYAVPLAVRWPIAHKMSGNIISHANIFRYVMEALSEDKTLLDHLSPNISLSFDNKLVLVRDGQICDPIERYAFEHSMENLMQRFEQKTASYEELKDLSSRLLAQNSLDTALAVLEYTYTAFPGDFEIPGMLAHLCLRTGNSLALRAAKSIYIRYNDKYSALEYYRSLAAYGTPEDITRFLDECKSRSSAIALEGSIILNTLLHRFAEAKEEASLCCQRHVSSPEGYLYYSKLLETAGDYSQALEVATKGVEQMSKNVDNSSSSLLLNHYTLLCGQCCSTEKFYKELVSRVDSRNKSSVWPRLLLSFVLQQQQKPHEALQLLADNIQTSGADHLLCARLGELSVFYKINDPQLEPYIVFSKRYLHTLISVIEEAEIFDPQWYRDRWMQPNDTMKPLRHYLTLGVYMGANPVPWFDTKYYLAQQDIWDAGVNPFVHFIQYGIVELRLPSLWADPAITVAKYPKIQSDRITFLRALHRMYDQKDLHQAMLKAS